MRARPAPSGRPSKTDSPLLEIMKKIALALLLLFCFRAVFAVTPFIITDIRVEGLERLEAGTVFNYLPLKVGDELNDEEARLSIKELFSTGFFKDVVLEQDGTTLVVKVVERPSIAEITITGNKVLESEALQNGLEQVGLVQGGFSTAPASPGSSRKSRTPIFPWAVIRPRSSPQLKNWTATGLRLR